MIVYTHLRSSSSRAQEERLGFSTGDSILMKINPWYLAAPLPFCLLAVHEALGAQLLVLGVTLGIFFGTLSLRRPAAGDATTTHH
jgi:hypothetical protein